jgi:hypothetical protein
MGQNVRRWFVSLAVCAAGCGGSAPAPAGSTAQPAAGRGQSGSASVAAGSGTAGAAGKSGRGGEGSGAAGSQSGAGSSGSGTSVVDAAGSDGGAGLATGSARLGSCAAFPATDAWNRVVENDPVSSSWTAHLQALVGAKKLHPDYGNSGDDHYGIPINYVPTTQAKVSVQFDDYPEESDPGPYPFPAPDAVHIEGGTPEACDGDCHLLVVQQGECRLYEGYSCHWTNQAWHCSNGAIWDLNEPGLGQRPDGWTSADAAGLPIAPGLVRYDEAQAGEIDHAIRFTLHCSSPNYVEPASHAAGNCASNADAPPMGLRVRLKASYDISKLSGGPHAVARAMQRYGMILADNGSDFYFQGEQDTRFTDADVEPLKAIPADAFEALEPGPLKSSH